MKTFDASFSAELLKENMLFYIAIQLQFSQTYYYTSLDRPVHYNENRYVPATISLGDLSYTGGGAVDYVNIQFGNAGLVMSALLLGEDVRGKTVIISVGLIDSTTHAVIEQEDLFQGMVDEWTIQEDRVNIRVANEFVLWKKRPLRNCSVTCPWDFKGTECGFSGGAGWCDKTWDRCLTLLNTNSFGGFRYAAAMVEKQIWWGKVFGKKGR